MLHTAANAITRSLIRHNLSHIDEADIYIYVIESILSTTVNIVLCLVISLALGMLLPGIAFMLTFIVLRKFTGGHHAKTHARCIATFCVISTASLCLIKWVIPGSFVPIFSCFAAILGVAVVFALAPVTHENKPLTTEQRSSQRRKSRVLIWIFAMGLVASALLWGGAIVAAVALGMLAVCGSMGFAWGIGKRGE